jgi:hypothetical protein
MEDEDDDNEIEEEKDDELKYAEEEDDEGSVVDDKEEVEDAEVGRLGVPICSRRRFKESSQFKVSLSFAGRWACGAVMTLGW